MEKQKKNTQNSRKILKTQGKNSSFSAFLKSCYVKKRAKGEACINGILTWLCFFQTPPAHAAASMGSPQSAVASASATPAAATSNGVVRNSVTTPETTSLSSLSHAGSNYSQQKSPPAVVQQPSSPPTTTTSEHIHRGTYRSLTRVVTNPKNVMTAWSIRSTINTELIIPNSIPFRRGPFRPCEA